ncbi:MAG TPA: hypothetical protein PLL55_12040, partial [Candidatus Aminicenantes bacterium]|nr:hypothetical protein [Candidatus Aminicenantes bacterium]
WGSGAIRLGQKVAISCAGLATVMVANWLLELPARIVQLGTTGRDSLYAEAVKVILFAVDPEIIVLGGSVSKAFAYFEQTLRDSLSNFPYSITIRNLKIDVSTTEHIAILGAAALIFDARK